MCTSDTIANATQCLLKVRYGTPGLQNSLLGSTGPFKVIGGRKEFIQVLHSSQYIAADMFDSYVNRSNVLSA